MFIGKHAFNKGLYDQAVQWLQTATQVAYCEGNNEMASKEIAPFLKTAIRVVGQYNNSNNIKSKYKRLYCDCDDDNLCPNTAR